MRNEGQGLNTTEVCKAGDSATPEAGETRVLVSLSLPVPRAWAHWGACAALSFRLHRGVSATHLQPFPAGKRRNWEEGVYRGKEEETRIPNGHHVQREGRRHVPAPLGKLAAAGRLGKRERLTGRSALPASVAWLESIAGGQELYLRSRPRPSEES